MPPQDFAFWAKSLRGNNDYSFKRWKNRKNVKKTAKREIKECLEYTESSIQLFKTENSVVYSEPKDAGTTERVKYVTTILVNFIIKQGCISLSGEIKNKTNTKQNPQQILKKNSSHRKRQKANKGCR